MMAFKIDKIKFPSLKQYLIQIHLDVKMIATKIEWDFGQPYTDFEILVILLEDRRYLMHRGVDWRSIARVVVKSLYSRQNGGASTIEMQLIRTATNRYEIKISRKLHEMILAFVINFHFSKSQMLRAYIEIAYFGTRIYGAPKASAVLFGKAVHQLNLQEAASLASMLVYPAPRVRTERWETKIHHRAAYGLRLYDRFKDSFDNLPMTQKV